MMLIGLFLSKFDKDGLKALGFHRFWEAYNTFALALGGRPKNINNYRDEFDPFFPNPRKGWVSRPLRPSRKAMMEKYAELSLDEFADLIRREVSFWGDADDVIKENPTEGDFNTTFAKRMMTGQSAENHFESHYEEIPLFKKASLHRTTSFGCGFDFKIEVEGSPYFAVEVKGMASVKGSCRMTDKEYRMADFLRDRYFLYVVRGFETPKPFYTVIQDPISSKLEFEKHEFLSRQIFWSSEVD